jgi:hypothetical protein
MIYKFHPYVIPWPGPLLVPEKNTLMPAPPAGTTMARSLPRPATTTWSPSSTCTIRYSPIRSYRYTVTM